MKQQQTARRAQGYMRKTNRRCRDCVWFLQGKGGPQCGKGWFPTGELSYCEQEWTPREGKP